MGRFYRTSVGAPIDYMYKIDAPLMESVLLNNDAGITQSLNQDSKLDALKNFNHISGNPTDDALAQQEQKNISDQADSISSAIQGDYANWKKQLTPLRQFQQSVQDNYTTGNISKLQANYNAMKQNFDTIDAQVALYNKTGGVDKNGNPVGISPIKAQLAKQYALNNYKGAIDPTTGAHNPFNPIGLMGELNLPKILSDELSKVKADKNVNEFTQLAGGRGGVQPYFNDVSHTWEGVPQDKLLSVALSRVMGDPGIMQNLRQAQQIGYLNNVFNSDGSLIKPFTSVDASQRTPQEQQSIDAEQHRINLLKRTDPAQAEQAQNQLNQNIQTIASRTKFSWNPNSYLSPILQSAIAKYSGTDVENKEKLRNNSLYNTQYVQGQENYRQGQGFAHDIVMARIVHDNKLDEMQKQADINASKLSGGKTGSGLSRASVIGQPTSSPFSYLGTDPEKITANLNNTILSNTRDIEQLSKEKDAYNKVGNTDMANYTSNLIKQKQMEMMTLTAREGKAREEAVDAVVPEKDKAIYSNKEDIIKNFFSNHLSSTDYNTAIKNPSENAVQLARSIKEFNNTPGSEFFGLADTPEGKEFIKATKYDNEVEDQYKNNLVKSVQNTTNGATEVGTTKSNNDFIKQAIEANPAGFKIFDSRGNTIGNFQDGKTNVDDLNIIGAGNSSGFDSGMMNIYAKDKKGNSAIIVPIDDKASSIIKRRLADDWSTSGDASAKQFANTWGSPYYDAVNNATTSIVQKDNNLTGLSSAYYTQIGLPHGQTSISIARVGNLGYKMQIEGRNGWQTVPNVDEKGKKIGNYFNSNADMVRILNMIGEAQQNQKK